MKKIMLLAFLGSYPALASDYLLKLNPQPTKVILNPTPDNQNPSKEVGDNGVCGSSHGLTLPSAPTSNLCQTPYGNTNVIENNGNFTWSCNGSEETTTNNSGNAVNCSSIKQESTLVCEVLFYNMTGYSYGLATLSQIEFNLKNNSKFVFGSLIEFTPISGTFSNAYVSASSRYSTGGNLYYANYAIKGYEGTGTGLPADYNEYWLGGENRASSYRVIFNAGQDLLSVTYADKSHFARYATNPENPNYNIQTFDCFGNVIKTYTLNNFISPSERQVGTFIFN